VGADLYALCREAAIKAYREDRNAQKVCARHFEYALEITIPSVDEATFKEYERMGRNVKRRRTSWDDVPFYG
jgi:SpoVK/Ycf46/Vps4 family AAA+-type ATPase